MNRSRHPVESPLESTVIAACDSTTDEGSQSQATSTQSTLTDRYDKITSRDIQFSSCHFNSQNRNIDPCVTLSPPPSYTTSLKNDENEIAHYRPAMMQTNIHFPENARNLPLRELNLAILVELSKVLDLDGPKNWKHLASLANISARDIAWIEQSSAVVYKTKEIIATWSKTMPLPSLGNFLDILANLGREDVLTDFRDEFLLEAERYELNQKRKQEQYLQRSESLQSQMSEAYSTAQYSSISETFKGEPSESALYALPGQNEFKQPLEQKGSGLPTSKVEEKYDALLFYHRENYQEIVKDIINRLEGENIKLCIESRDYKQGGTQVETDYHYMFQLSRKVIIVMSDELFNDGNYMWHINMLIGKDPVARQRKIIPVKYKPITVPNMLDYLCCCDRMKAMEDEWFWSKLINSVKSNP